jgi:hypothetical protein
MDVVFPYLQAMNDIISGLAVSDVSGNFPQCERNGVDQGLHNVLVHKKMIDNLRVFTQTESLVANMQAKRATIQGEDFEVYNPQGVKVSIVHQYDRYPELQSNLFHKVSKFLLYHRHRHRHRISRNLPLSSISTFRR